MTKKMSGEEMSGMNERDMNALVAAETEVIALRARKTLAMRAYNEQIKGIETRIKNYVRRLNGEDPQEELEV